MIKKLLGSGVISLIIEILAGVAVIHFIDSNYAIKSKLPGYPNEPDTTDNPGRPGLFGGFSVPKLIYPAVIIAVTTLLLRFLLKKLHIKL